MTINKHPKADNADLTEKNTRDQDGRVSIDLEDEILEIGQRCSKLPTLDKRTPSQIIRYGST